MENLTKYEPNSLHKNKMFSDFHMAPRRPCFRSQSRRRGGGGGRRQQGRGKRALCCLQPGPSRLVKRTCDLTSLGMVCKKRGCLQTYLATEPLETWGVTEESEGLFQKAVKGLPVCPAASKAPPRNLLRNPKKRSLQTLRPNASSVSQLTWFWEKLQCRLLWPMIVSPSAPHLSWVISPTYPSCSFFNRAKISRSRDWLLVSFMSVIYKTLIVFLNRDHPRQTGTSRHLLFMN